MEDERKLFYVAVTRAKKYMYITRAKETRDKTVSTFFEEAKGAPSMLPYSNRVVHNVDHLPELRQNQMPLMLNFSLLEDYFECPYRFKLSMFYGFVQPFTELIGYGNAMHDIVRNHQPCGNQRQMMLESAKRGIKKYVERNQSTFDDIRMAETPIEIDMGDGVTVNGRIDMVKEVTIDGQKRTVIVDFKTANKRVQEAINSEQLKIYALGYQKLTGTPADFMEIYHLDSENTARELVTTATVEGVEAEIRQAADSIRRNDLPKNCSKESYSKCRLGHLCLSKADQKKYT